jgi:16S rRNA G1207 methylase RsmC
MITKDRVLEIINSTNPGELEQIHVITRYIFDKTGEDISGVNINPPQHQGMVILMTHMYNTAKKHYRTNGE